MLCIDKYVRLQKLFITKVCSEKSIMAFLLDASVLVRAMSQCLNLQTAISMSMVSYLKSCSRV